MVTTTASDHVRSRRREQTRAEILDAAWRLSERDGIAGLSLRELASEVGMRAPSLYTYFGSKAAIYDEMFAQGYRDLDAVDAQLTIDPDDPVGTLAASAKAFIDFCCASLARFQLMFTRAVPGWEPSAEAYAVSVSSYERSVDAFAQLGIDEPRHVDLLTALFAGLASQQLANDPGGDRWRQLSREAAEMYVGHVAQGLPSKEDVVSVDMTRSVREIPRISRDTDAREIATGAYERLLDLLEQLEPEEWRAPTECPGWDVAAMVGHLIGAAKQAISLRESVRQQRWAKRHAHEFDGSVLDASTALQVRDHAHLAPEERLEMLREVAPVAVRARMRLPRAIRRKEIKLDAAGSLAPGSPTKVSLGEIMDVTYTRDVWLHRIDIARATGRPADLDVIVDRRIVEDVVAEWSERHGQAFHLTLSGPAGGEFRQGEGGVNLEFDAVDFCRILSGRAHADGLLTTRLLF